MTYLHLSLRLSLAGVFLVSGLAKARAIDGAVLMCKSLFGTFWPARKNWAGPAARALVVTEVATGLALVVPGSDATTALGLLAAIGLLMGFTALAVVTSRRQLALVCACFGRAGAPLGRRHVWRNLALLAIGASALFLLPEAGSGTWDTGGTGVAVTAAAVVTLLTFYYDEIADLLSGNW
ncbi:MauE/DoxX family redox-associated membrane protein [Streptomyces cyanogenus]|uniref:Methylamine utilisation protein MauE domain-containing protein n=1 Tax=Streptomyces cyanogenus TaxID=80860 RepID=A0ABX7TX18_STRCY|nr:hypothetical protein S1361_28600 [Streptomyces cyanogenus]